MATITEELLAIIKTYTDYLTSLGIPYELSINSTYTAFSIKLSGPIATVRGTVTTSVSSGVALDNVVVTKGYIGYTALKTTINPKTGIMSIENLFSYASA